MNNQLPNTVKRLLFSQVFFEFGRVLFSLFFSIFIWSETQSLQLVALYNIVVVLAHTVALTIFAPMVKRGRSHSPRNISLIFSASFFLLLFFIRDVAIDYILPIGFFSGFFSGMYWISYNLLKFDLTHTKNRGHFVGTLRSLEIFAGLTAPAIGGALISLNVFGFGYGNIFILASICNLLTIFVGAVKAPSHPAHPFHLGASLKILIRDKDLVKINLAKLFGNIGYRGSMEKLLPIFIFAVVQDEFEVGGWLSLFSAVAVVTTYLMGRKLSYGRYKKAMLVGGSLFFLATLSLVGWPILITFILYGFAREILLPWQMIPVKVYSENLIHRLPDFVNHRVEYIVIREWIYVFFSRVFSYSLLFFVTDLTGTAMQLVLFLLAVFILLEPLVVKTIETDLEKL